MRFLYYDAVTHLESGKSITGVKTFSLSEEFLRGHYKKIALVPAVIMIEAMAQLLGWLIIYSHGFRLTPIMSLVEGVTLSPRLRPGFKAEIHGQIVSSSKRDSLGKAQMYVEGKQVASLERIIYSHFHQVTPEDLAQLFRYYSGWKNSGP
jgi:3-hydroxymyristoyl/3-hydroxydecanoyl-(acyl carrier protein) dehydratase